MYLDLTLIKCNYLYNLFFFTTVVNVAVVLLGRSTINQLPDDKMLDWFKLKEVSDDISRCHELENHISNGKENIVTKEEIAC